MYVTTGEATKLLNISSRRLLDLLQKGRVVGAYKSGRYWLIPLNNGLPQIIAGKRGRRGTWNTSATEKKTIVHINKNHIQQNTHRTESTRKPVIAIKNKKCSQGKASANLYARSLEIPYPCRIVYQPDNPLHSLGARSLASYADAGSHRCGAKVWIEVLGGDLIAIQPPGHLIPYSMIN